MISVFSGHSEIDTGNSFCDYTEHGVAKEIIAKLGFKSHVDYFAEQCDMKYRILDAIEQSDKTELCVVLHFPCSHNRLMNGSTVIYDEHDYVGYSYAVNLSNLCIASKMKVSIVSQSQCNYHCNFLMKKSSKPVLVFEPFYLSHVGQSIPGEIQRCSLILKQLRKIISSVKKNLD